ncbi:acyltransferase [Nocardiopsis ansamitocini]|uniref:DUF3352 domain-containing protein n=1 Tax=Nocardiopsis ansamitocini TaxID=1670832 RepID=A0A9W6UHY2_9ACTN|nr:acyltransferase [Nocardiopsis ansamitocini]GLU46833.1 hypothetical protein Nans01_11840 [Nocardiopsis ansamitocini]
MSYPDPPNQPPQQWGQQPVQGQPGYGYPPQGPPPGHVYQPAPGPAPRKKSIWLVPASVVVALALMGTTVWASTALVNNLFGGPQPETVLPGSSLMFAKVDLKPTGGQWASYAQFYNKLPDSVRDELGGSEEDPARAVVEEAFPELDYVNDVEPWLGQRFGFAVWEGPDSAPVFAVAIAAENEGKATETLEKVHAESQDFSFVVKNGFALVTTDDASLADLDGQIAQYGTLDKNETFATDIDEIGEGVATLWGDIGGLSKSALGASNGSFDDLAQVGDLDGRVAAVLRLESDYLEFRADAYAWTVDGEAMLSGEVPAGGITALNDLPDNSVIAVGGDGLDALAQQVWETNSDTIESSPDFADANEAFQQMGVALPGDFTKLLGTTTAIGFTDIGDDFFGSGDDGSFEVRLAGADQGIWEEFAAGTASGGYTTGPGVSADGDTTVLSYGTAGTGRLGDDPVFQQTMKGLEGAHIGFYMDGRYIAQEAEEANPEQWGGIGGAVELSDGGGSSTILRWVPSPS